MKTVNELLADKLNGIDCNDDESAEIKAYFREKWNELDRGRGNVFFKLMKAFPLEFGEVWDEFDLEPHDFELDRYH